MSRLLDSQQLDQSGHFLAGHIVQWPLVFLFQPFADIFSGYKARLAVFRAEDDAAVKAEPQFTD